MLGSVFEVKWTGGYPNLCSGEWEISYKGTLVQLPEEIRTSSMDTYGSYSQWHFEDWLEVFESYESGMLYDSWIRKNNWAEKITEVEEELQELFNKIQDQDWRHGSCGGCI